MTTRPTSLPALGMSGPAVPGLAASAEVPQVAETTGLAPLSQTHPGVTVWAVPGREPGQTRELRHLIWSGPGDYVHLCYGGIADGETEYPGEDMGRVSGRCFTFKQAQAAVDAYVSGQRI